MSLLTANLRRQLRLVLIVTSTLLLHQSVFAQTVILRVDGDVVSPGGDGTGWGDDAFKFLQDALVEAAENATQQTPYELWVAATDPSNPYRPDRDAANEGGTGLRESTFLLNFNNVQVLGGFLGNEIDPSDRNPALYETVLSGDITNPWENCAPGTGDCFMVTLGIPGCDNMCNGEPCPGCCELVCDSDPSCCLGFGQWDELCVSTAMQVCLGAEAPYGAYHVVTALNVDQTVRIDGFTITLGSAVGIGNDQLGAGMSILNASPAVVRCTFTSNTARGSGGLPTVEGRGGGMSINGDFKRPWIINVIFEDNPGDQALIPINGGGLASNQADPILTNCLFVNNFAQHHGGGIYNLVGICEGCGDITLVNCTLVSNTANTVNTGFTGGGLYADGTGSIVTVDNSIF